MKKSIFVCLSFFLMSSIYGQQKVHLKLIKKAELLYAEKNYDESAKTYSKAFAINAGKGERADFYSAACSWSLAKNADSAFKYLSLCSEMNYSNYRHISTDADLNAIHSDARWEPLLKKVKTNREQIEAKYNKPLQQELLKIFEDDQKYRMERSAAIKVHGVDSKTVDSLTKLMLAVDSANLIKITASLDKRGWISPDEVGWDASITQWLVIQHADLATQVKYLPIMRKAVRDITPENLGTLEDRIALRQGKKQLYGSQLMLDDEKKYIVLPLEDPDNVEKRRAKLGMGTLDSYLKFINKTLKWDPKQYKKDLPRIEAYFKKVQEEYGKY